MTRAGTRERERDPGDITKLLSNWTHGDQRACGELFDATYQELKRIARAQMRRERADHTLQPSALINEFFIRISRSDAEFKDRSHFLAIASSVMRHILVDYAKTHNAAKNGSGAIKIQIKDLHLPDGSRDIDPILIDELLTRFAQQEPRCAQVVEMRCFGGFTNAEIAAAISKDERTVKRDWRFARAWLIAHLGKGCPHVTREMDSHSDHLR